MPVLWPYSLPACLTELLVPDPCSDMSRTSSLEDGLRRLGFTDVADDSSSLSRLDRKMSPGVKQVCCRPQALPPCFNACTDCNATVCAAFTCCSSFLTSLCQRDRSHQPLGTLFQRDSRCGRCEIAFGVVVLAAAPPTLTFAGVRHHTVGYTTETA